MAPNETPKPPRLGRCKDCDFALFAADADQATVVDSFKGVREAGVVYRVGNDGFFGRCPNRHRVFMLKPIKGTYSEDHQCDSRCLNAKGHSCTCSCGGANHGRGHAVTTVTAHAPAPDRTVTQAAQEHVAPAADGITDRQVIFLTNLLNERELPEKNGQTGEERREIALLMAERKEFTKKSASSTIEWLLTLPKRQEA